MKSSKLVPIGAAILLASFCTGCNKLKARNEINKGVIAFKSSQFPEAVDDFQRAVSFDPTMLMARLYLATALAQQFVPGGNTPANIQMGNRAIDAYKEVLKLDPKNTNALGSIGNIYFGMHNYDQSKVYQQKVMQIEPNNPTPYYWIGVLDWYPVYARAMQLRGKLNLTKAKDPAKPAELPPLPPKDRNQLAQQNGPLIQEGIDNLQKAIQLKPNYAAAYSYLNLLYQRKADIEPSNDERMADLQKANDLGTKALTLMKAEAAAKAKAAENAG